MAELYRQLEKYRDMDYYPFHMPGHKRNGEAVGAALAESCGLDITEIDGFDNLHQAKGILREEQERAAGLYGAGQSYYLVNGSTCGILGAIFAVTKKGDRILMARNCHKAVYHAVYMRELEAVYLQPGIITGQDAPASGMIGAVEPETVERALREHPDCAAVIITSPTYEGVVSDVERIAGIVHAYGIPMIVDEAHGAHFGFHEAYPASSVVLGADLVIHSVHKTLPAMTQAALLHWNWNKNKNWNWKNWEDGGKNRNKDGKEDHSGNPGNSLADRERLERYLRIFQTSSPSYVLMASVSRCMEIVDREGWERLDRLLEYRRGFMEKINACDYVTVFGEKWEPGNPGMRCDPCKLVISIKDGRMTGQELYDILLEKYHLQMEMASEDYVLAIVTMMDTQEGWNRLADALVQINDGLGKLNRSGNRMTAMEGTDGKGLWQVGYDTVMTLAQAYDAPWEITGAEDGTGRIAAEFIHLYPPGIPVVAPGERLTGEIMETLSRCQRLGLNVQGMENGLIKVIKE